MINRLLGYLIKEKIINEDEREIYLFGMEQWTAKVKHIVIIIIISILFGKAFEAVIFTLLYSILREYAGGFHADSEKLCFLTTIFIISELLVLLTFFDKGTLDVMFVVLIIISWIFIWHFGPVDNKNKPLDKIEKKHYSNRLKQILVIVAIIIFVFYYFFRSFIYAFGISLIIEGEMIFYGLLKNRRGRKIC